MEEGDGVLQKYAKTYKGRGVFQEYTYANIFLKECFHILTAYVSCFSLL